MASALLLVRGLFTVFYHLLPMPLPMPLSCPAPVLPRLSLPQSGAEGAPATPDAAGAAGACGLVLVDAGIQTCKQAQRRCQGVAGRCENDAARDAKPAMLTAVLARRFLVLS